VNAERQRDAAERMAEYAAYLRSGFSRETAARYVGVSADTGYRYESALRRQQVAA
jgi:transposase